MEKEKKPKPKKRIGKQSKPNKESNQSEKNKVALANSKRISRMELINRVDAVQRVLVKGYPGKKIWDFMRKNYVSIEQQYEIDTIDKQRKKLLKELKMLKLSNEKEQAKIKEIEISELKDVEVGVDVSWSTLNRYIKHARKRILKTSEKDSEYKLQLHYSRREAVFSAALEDSDYKSALAAVEDIAKLEGRYVNKVENTLSGGVEVKDSTDFSKWSTKDLEKLETLMEKNNPDQ
jgi:hypothetical protein